MNFIDLCEAIDRLKNDPRVHPNTPVELAYSFYEWGDETAPMQQTIESNALVSISLNGCITLSTEPSRSAVAR